MYILSAYMVHDCMKCFVDPIFKKKRHTSVWPKVIHSTFIGQEFQAIFVSTTEPIDKDGSSYNPTTSPCDHYVFNTILTRAKSLVVMVGSPWVLLNTEAHMAKLSGGKARCWSLYLRSCLENGTFIIPSLVEPDQSISEKFKEQLADYLGATRPPGDHFSASKVSHSLPLSPLLKDFQPVSDHYVIVNTPLAGLYGI